MGINAVNDHVILELSQAAYDEIERKLLEAGYDHVFLHGPGSLIDMSHFSVARQDVLTMEHVDRAKAFFKDQDRQQPIQVGDCHFGGTSEGLVVSKLKDGELTEAERRTAEYIGGYK